MRGVASASRGRALDPENSFNSMSDSDPQAHSKFASPYIANNGYDLARAQTAVRSGAANLVAFGIPFLANPDLVRRYRENLPLNAADPATFYGGSEAGYTDYPFYRGE